MEISPVNNVNVVEMAAPDVISKLISDKRSNETKRAYQKDLEEFFSFFLSKSYLNTLKDFFVSNLGNQLTPALVKNFLSLPKVKALEVALDYKASLLERNLSEATVNRKLSSLRALVSLAYSIGYCSYKLDGIPNEKIKTYRDTSGVGVEQIAKALEIPDRATLKGKRDYVILLLLWENGLRRSEVINCDVKGFNKDDKTLLISGKGKGSQKELIYLSDKTTRAIEQYLEIRNSTGIALFENVDRAGKGNGRLSSQAIYYLVRDIFKKAGISKLMSPHRVRHSAITAALDITNGNIRSVQRFSRHSKLETLQVYDDNRHKYQADVTNLLSCATLIED